MSFIRDAIAAVRGVFLRQRGDGGAISKAQTSESAIEKFRESVPNVQVLPLPSDFSTAEASQAGTELVDRVRSVLTA
jgi:hypothetical protein